MERWKSIVWVKMSSLFLYFSFISHQYKSVLGKWLERSVGSFGLTDTPGMAASFWPVCSLLLLRASTCLSRPRPPSNHAARLTSDSDPQPHSSQLGEPCVEDSISHVLGTRLLCSFNLQHATPTCSQRQLHQQASPTPASSLLTHFSFSLYYIPNKCKLRTNWW